MTIWSPRQSIRVISIGLHWRDGLLLAAELRDDTGKVTGVRPLGGGVEFGETWRQALVREFKEELNVQITIGSNPLVIENLYVHEGQPGHEIVFAADVKFAEGEFDGQDVIEFEEDNGGKFTASWVDLDELNVGGVELYSTGLKALLQARR